MRRFVSILALCRSRMSQPSLIEVTTLSDSVRKFRLTGQKITATRARSGLLSQKAARGPSSFVGRLRTSAAARRRKNFGLMRDARRSGWVHG